MRSNLTDVERQQVKDVRWTHSNLVVSVKSNVTTCPHRRCAMMADGSLRFSHVLAEDEGKYWMQAFDKHGHRVKTTDVQLLVDRSEAVHRSDITATDLPSPKGFEKESESQH